MSAHRKELLSLEEKAELLISLAMRKGADANFLRVRRLMKLGRRYGSDEMIYTAIAHLERAISKTNRENTGRSSRRALSVRFKNLIGIGS